MRITMQYCDFMPRVQRDLNARESEILKNDQANKSTGRMPWHQEPTKDVDNCDKPWGAVIKHRSMDFRMGKPGTSNRITVA